MALASLGAASLLAWLVNSLRPARSWDLRPAAEDDPQPPDPAAWPPVCVIVPARNEGSYLPRTLPSLLAQDYPGSWRAVLVDDRSCDGTAEVARGLGRQRVTVINGRPLPRGWRGKVWALAQGTEAAAEARYLLLTDADIRHAPGSLRRLVAESESAGLALNSRMARLRTDSAAERLLIPPFLFFFNLLYPMRAVNGAGRAAAAAGGCVLIRTDALEQIGGFRAIAGEVIDDVNLARAVKRLGVPIRLSVSRSDAVSIREYRTARPIWRMVRRSAFDQLRYSWLLLAGAVSGLVLLFGVPPTLVAIAAAAPFAAGWRVTLALLGSAALAVTTLVFLPSVRLLGVPTVWAVSFPLAGLLYAAMTVDSALRHSLGRPTGW